MWVCCDGECVVVVGVVVAVHEIPTQKKGRRRHACSRYIQITAHCANIQTTWILCLQWGCFRGMREVVEQRRKHIGNNHRHERACFVRRRARKRVQSENKSVFEAKSHVYLK